MKIDLSKPHRKVGSLVIYLDSNQVFRVNGNFVGVLPKGSAPATPEQILKAVEKKDVTVQVEVAEHRGASIAQRRGELAKKTVTKTFIAEKTEPVKKKKGRKKK